jgi:hypothetical protein
MLGHEHCIIGYIEHEDRDSERICRIFAFGKPKGWFTILTVLSKSNMLSARHVAFDLKLDPFPHCQFDREAEAASDNVSHMLLVSSSYYAIASLRPHGLRALISTHISMGLSNQCHRIRLIADHACIWITNGRELQGWCSFRQNASRWSPRVSVSTHFDRR